MCMCACVYACTYMYIHMHMYMHIHTSISKIEICQRNVDNQFFSLEWGWVTSPLPFLINISAQVWQMPP